MKTLTVTLKQHTPLIHFQHDQYGATLRASEVKPKLDRFLLKKLNDEKNKDDWFLKNTGKSLAFNYKMKILPCEIKYEYLIASYLNRDSKEYLYSKNIEFIDASPYFAQEKQNKKIVREEMRWSDITCKGLIFKDKMEKCEEIHEKEGERSKPFGSVVLSICSLREDLLNWMAEQVQSFFLVENFATRQDKGFGSFEVVSIRLGKDDKNYLLKSNEEILSLNFKFCFKKTVFKPSMRTIFRIINDDYKLLKSGRNNQFDRSKPPYEKSKLMLYGLDNKQRWEKKFLKERINKVYLTRDGITKYELKSFNSNNEYSSIRSDEHYVYLRALLGLANQYEFLLRNPPAPQKKMIVSVNGISGVERFKSPITFKVIDDSIYMVGNDLSKEILNKEFHYTVTVQEDEMCKDREIEDVLKTPRYFDLVGFMNKYAIALGYKKIK